MPLPRGRHGIDRDEIRAHQRGRLVEATIECVADRGYALTTVGHIVSRARVSRETFYELFSDKEDCYVASLADTIGDITSAWGEAASDRSLAPADRIEAGLRGYFASLAERPAVAKCFILERPSNRQLTEADNEADPEMLRMIAAVAGVTDLFAVRAYLAMVEGIVRQFVIQDQVAELPGVLPQLMPIVRRVLGI
jgi:AcrR family transcriptional regulator